MTVNSIKRSAQKPSMTLPIVLLLCLACGAATAAAASLEVRGFAVAEGPFSTRVILATNEIAYGEEGAPPATTWKVEYATTEAALDNGTGVLVAHGLNCCGESPGAVLIQHLVPDTHYFARIQAQGSKGFAEANLQFTTHPVAAPEVPGGVRLSGEDNAIGTDYADFETGGPTPGIQTNGAETHYVFETAESAGGPWTPVHGAEGVVTAVEDSVRVAAHITGLAPERQYYIRILTRNEQGEFSTEPLSFTTAPLYPFASGDKTEAVTETSARLLGNIAPHSSETHYRFEVARSEGGPWTVVPGSEGVIAAAEADERHHFPLAEITGLSPDSVYYFRTSAENVFGPSRPEGTATGIRSFETEGPPSASTFATHVVDGEAMRALGLIYSHGRPTDYHFEYVTAERFAAKGFAGASVTPELAPSKCQGSPCVVGADLPSLQPGVEYRFRAVATGEGESGGQHVAYGEAESLRVPVVAPAAPAQPCPNGRFRGSLSSHLPDCRAYEQITPTQKRGAEELFSYGTSTNGGAMIGEDGEHVMEQAPFTNWGLTGQAPYFFARGSSGWQLTPGTPEPEAGVSRYLPEVYSPDLTQFGLRSEVNLNQAQGGQSANIEFRVGPAGGPYATVAVVPRNELGQDGGWVGASEDFSKLILMVEDRRLVEPQTSTVSGFDLYEYSGGQLRQVNVGVGRCGAVLPEGQAVRNFYSIDGEGGREEYDHHAVSADGSRVFFEAVPGESCGGASHLFMRVNGAETVDIGAYKFVAADSAGSKVLVQDSTDGDFLYEPQRGAVARLASEAEVAIAEEQVGIARRYSYGVPAELTPYLNWNALNYISPVANFAAVFGTKQDLVPQILRYDSVEKALECISCASPFDPEPRLLATFPEPDGFGGIEPAIDGLPRTKFVSAGGDYVFFTTPAALVPEDVDGEIEPESSLGGTGKHNSTTVSLSSDIYEWRRAGLDGCTRVEGCLSLITPGTGGVANLLLGTDASGRDVFIETDSQLVPSDQDSAGDIYDVRIDGGFPEAARPVECEGDACSTPASPPVDATPASFTFSGAGDLTSPALAAPRAAKTKKVKHRPKSKRPRAKRGRRARRRKAPAGRGANGAVRAAAGRRGVGSGRSGR